MVVEVEEVVAEGAARLVAMQPQEQAEVVVGQAAECNKAEEPMMAVPTVVVEEVEVEEVVAEVGAICNKAATLEP